MDKNKVKELILKGMRYQSKSRYVSSYKEKAKVCFNDALAEVIKSDWISVDDELPDYEESVLVTSSEDTEDIYFSHRTKRPDVVVENNGFTTFVGAPKITHWQRIKELEE